MSYPLLVIARTIASIALAAVAVVHVVWASGSAWPARSEEDLAEAVVGQRLQMPSTAPTLVVAGGTAGAAAVAARVLGSGRLQGLLLGGMGAAMLLRGVLGGQFALRVLGMPAAGDRFRRLDATFYRPFATVTGTALLVVARSVLKR